MSVTFDRDNESTELLIGFNKTLTKKMRSRSFGEEEFLRMLKCFFKKFAKLNYNLREPDDDYDYHNEMLKILSSSIPETVGNTIWTCCLRFEIWDLVETLIVYRAGDSFAKNELISLLISKKNSYLICEHIKNSSTLLLSQIQELLKFLVSLPVIGSNVFEVEGKWRRQVQLARELMENHCDDEKIPLATKAWILLTTFSEGFLSFEVCLHYLFSSTHVTELDDASFKCILVGLQTEEFLVLIRYFGKSLSKYKDYPQMVPCPEAAILLGLDFCLLIPSIEFVAKCLELVVDFIMLSDVSSFYGRIEEFEMLSEVVETLGDRISPTLNDAIKNLCEMIRQSSFAS